jgi:hypothetical protein
MNVSTMDDWLADFRTTIESATEQLLAMPEEQALVRKSEGKWSSKQIVGHLIDSAANNHQRFVRAQFTDDLVFPGYEQEAWVEAQRYNDEPWTQLVQLWRLYNLHLWHVMSAIPEAVRTRSRRSHTLDRVAWQTVAESEPATLEYFMRDYVAHLQHHLDQVFAAS